MLPKRPVLAVGAVVINHVGQVLLIRRGKPPRLGGWSLPGGKVEWGESLVEATAREVHEETGLSVRVGPLLEVVELTGPDHHFVVLDYLAALTSAEGENLPQAGDDASEAIFCDRNNLPAYDLTPEVLRVIAKGYAVVAAAGSGSGDFGLRANIT